MKLTKLAQEVFDRVQNGEHPNDINEEFDFPWCCGDGFGYCIFDGGYIKPEDIVEGEDLLRVKYALKIVEEFKKIVDTIQIEM